MKRNFQIDFVGIGASKAGTTWLGHILAEHPAICMSEPKEVHFFNDKIAFRNPIMKPNFSKGLEWYRKYFAHCKVGKIRGEITPRYSTDPVVPERLYAHNKDIKILYCLRNPIDRIESQYNFYKYFVGIEDRPLDQAVRVEPEYLEMSMYYSHLMRFRNHFSPEQICLIWFEDIAEQPGMVLKQVYSFLGVETSFKPSSAMKHSNPGRKSRSAALQFFVRRVTYVLVALGFSGVLHRLKRTRIKDWMMKWNSKPLQKEPMPVKTREFILEKLQNDLIELEKLTHRDLSHWRNV